MIGSLKGFFKIIRYCTMPQMKWFKLVHRVAGLGSVKLLAKKNQRKTKHDFSDLCRLFGFFCFNVFSWFFESYAQCLIVVSFSIVNFFVFSSWLGTVKSDIEEICREFVIPASRTFLNLLEPPKPLKIPNVRDDFFYRKNKTIRTTTKILA